METVKLADPNCAICSAGDRPGRVKTGPGITDWSVCPCVLRNQRLMAAQIYIERNFPKRSRDMTFDTFDTGGIDKNDMALRVARNFCNNFELACEEGWTLVLWGKPAAGKTHLAMAMANECVTRFLAKAHFVNLPQLLRSERERFNSDGFQASEITIAGNAELLVFDDLGAEYDRLADQEKRVSWVQEQIYEILDARYMNKLPTIITSNLSPGDMKRQFGESGERIMSRIQRSEAVPPLEIIAVPGKNRQNEAAAALLHS